MGLNEYSYSTVIIIGQEEATTDDERHINGHTAVSRYRSELCITDLSHAGEKSPGVPGFGHARVPWYGDGMALLPPGVPHTNDPGDELEDAVGGGEHTARERESERSE